MRVVLIGFMGAGKSTVGSLLAKNLGLRFIELDDLVIERSGCTSIAELVDTRGEKAFRDIEAAVAREQSNVENVVISPGGGIIGREENFTSLVPPGTVVVFLKTSFETISNRIPSAGERPLFRDKVKARQLFDERQAVYEKWATFSIATDSLSPENIAREITTTLQSR